MSDFLSKFTKENYDREKMKISEDTSPSSSLESEIEETNSKDLLNNPVLSTHLKEETNSEDQLNNPISNTHLEEETEYLREEATELDPEYANKRKKKILLFSILALIISIGAGYIYYQSSHTLMPNFINVEKQEVSTWANKNNISVIFEEIFDTNIDENIVIEQSVEPQVKIKKGSNLNVIVSLGADPDELISIPDFNQLNGGEIETWIYDNKMRYIQVEYLFSNEIEEDMFIAFEIKDKDVSKENFSRKNKALLTISKGQETFEKDILVLDFKNKSKEDVEAWMKEKEFVNKFTFEESYHDVKFEGEVISQSIGSGEKVAKDEILNFVISKGKAMIVPDYANSEMNSFDTINTNGATVINKEIYTMTYPYGNFVEQSIAPGTVLNDTPDQSVIVYYSLGKPYIKDLVGQFEGDLPAFFYEFKGQSANITYKVHKIKDCATKGSVTKASKNNEFITTSDHVDVYISDGSGVCDTPDFEGE